MLDVTCCCVLLGVVAQRQTLWVNNSGSNISIVQGIAERGTTMIDLLAQLSLQHFWDHARPLHMVSLETATQLLRVILQPANIGPTLLGDPFAHHSQDGRNHFQHCWLNNVGSCCVRLQLAWYPSKRIKNNSLYSFNRVASPSESSSSDSSSDEDDSKPADDATNKNNIPLDSFVVNIEDEKKEGKDAESVM